MNKLVLVGIGVFALIIAYLYIDTSTKTIETSIENKSIKTEQFSPKVEKKKVDIIYLDKERKEDASKVEKHQSEAEELQVDSSIKDELASQNLKVITKKLDENGYTPRFSVYADTTVKEIEEKNNNSMPPLAPTIVNGIFPSGQTYSVVVPTEVINSAQNIVITQNNPDGTITESTPLEIPSTDEQTTTSTIDAPPSPGMTKK